MNDRKPTTDETDHQCCVHTSHCYAGTLCPECFGSARADTECGSCGEGVPTGEDEEDDTSRDLSGGTLGTDRIDPGPTDSFMGFTNGREAGDDDRADRC